jgi:tetratricopeptide (TPR) repeat protein/transcriptional regulator with XRE-family HTH domain
MGDTSFGTALRRARERHGMSLATLSRLVHYSKAYLSRVETGQRQASSALAMRCDEALGADGALAGLVAPRTPPGPAMAVPQVRYSLPADTAAFTGRDAELNQVTAAVAAGANRAGGVVAVGAIDGMPGVGKTALAVHVAHLLAEEFPDRQLFIDLHGHTPGHEPMRPQDALAGLLAATGVDPRYLPADLDGRAAMWRDRMTGQRALLVLDNAADSSQVAPLLPGGGCLVLVTSRRHLGDLPGAVTPVLLDVLLPGKAEEMFTRLASRAAADRDGVQEVVRLAGFLPLAICLLARVFARHPSWKVADLTAETRAGLLTMAAENDSVAAAFEVSYRHLDRARQRLFRLLGVHPGEVIDGYAAAALAGIRLPEAIRLLDGLHQEGLVTEAGPRRYGMHDLLRRYARDLADAPAHAAGSQKAVERLLDYYQYTSAQAATRLARQVRPGPAAAFSASAEIPALEDADQALAWARADRASLLACLDLTVRTGRHARVVALTAGLTALLWRDGPWAEAVTRHAAAVAAARCVTDRLGEANALTDLGTVLRLTGDYSGAAEALDEALGIYRQLGARLGEANALDDLAAVRLETGDHRGAALVLEEALGIYRDLGNRLGEANALTDLGTVLRLTGHHLEAAGMLEEALGMYRAVGNPLGEARALLHLGIVREATGDYRGAAGVLEEALGIYRGLGNRLGEANALTDLGIVLRLTGERQSAARVLEEALGIYRGLGNRLGEANALLYLGIAAEVTGDHHAAAAVLEEAMGIYRRLGERLGEANALLHLATIRRVEGDCQRAADLLQDALSIYRDLGNRQGEAEALNEQGTLYRVRGDFAGAQKCHQQALELAGAIGSSLDEACALAGQGRCAIARGRTTEAEALLRQALEIYQRIGAAETQGVLAELDALRRRPGPRVSA